MEKFVRYILSQGYHLVYSKDSFRNLVYFSQLDTEIIDSRDISNGDVIIFGQTQDNFVTLVYPRPHLVDESGKTKVGYDDDMMNFIFDNYSPSSIYNAIFNKTHLILCPMPQ